MSAGSLASSALTLDGLSSLIPLVIMVITIIMESSFSFNAGVEGAFPCKLLLGEQWLVQHVPDGRARQEQHGGIRAGASKWD